MHIIITSTIDCSLHMSYHFIKPPTRLHVIIILLSEPVTTMWRPSDKLLDVISLNHLKRKECRIINPCSNFTDTHTHTHIIIYIICIYISDVI